jgi:RNA polymerase sigma-70 factor (ECF subfamily)
VNRSSKPESEPARAVGDAMRAPEADWSVLMARSQSGDAASYRLLLIAVTPYLRSLAHRFGLGGPDLEDAVQDVLLTIHAIRQTYDPARPFAPWLTAVARHRLLDRLRRRVRQFGRETELTEFHETFAAVETNLIEAAGDAGRLRAAIARLPEGQRSAVEMLKLNELSLKEAAAKSGQSETALKVAVHRAIKRLRILLGDEDRS